ncbi:hypothetical protein OROMI_007578 [Orobanche minor]
MATAILPVSFSGGNNTKISSISSVNSGAFMKTRPLTIQSKTRSRTNPKLSIRAQYEYGMLSPQKMTLFCTIGMNFLNPIDDFICLDNEKVNRSSGSGADFLAGLVLGGAVFGTLAYVFAPQIRRSVLNENEHGFRRAKEPIYYDGDGGLERTRQTLEEKISQLNAAIDNVSSRLRGGSKFSKVPVQTDAEEA